MPAQARTKIASLAIPINMVSNVKLMASESPSYFHGWSPDNKTLAFVAQ
jgi:hypothetical protein